MYDRGAKLGQYLIAAQESLGAAVTLICEGAEDEMLVSVGKQIIKLLHELQSLQESVWEAKRPATTAANEQADNSRSA